jgi:hypothetical protein
MRAHRSGDLCRQAEDVCWTGHMGTIVKFPEDGRIVRFGRAEAADESATVIILPVIRVERHDGLSVIDDVEPLIPPPPENGGRRRIRRR